MCSPCQFNHLDFIAQFTTDNRYISGQDIVADSLSQVEAITAPITHAALAAAQEDDDKLHSLLVSNRLTARKTPNPWYLIRAVLRQVLRQTSTMRPVLFPLPDIQLLAFPQSTRNQGNG
jgi:hypothetical protein